MNNPLTRLTAAVAMALCAAAAHAQTARDPVTPAQSPLQPSITGLSVVRPDFTVTLYGLIDATISEVSHADAAGNHLLDYQVPWFSGSRWGITGRRAIVGDTNAIFKLESEYVIQTGEIILHDTAQARHHRSRRQGATHVRVASLVRTGLWPCWIIIRCRF